MFVMMSTPMLSLNTMNGYWQSSRKPVPNWKKHTMEHPIINSTKNCFEQNHFIKSKPTINVPQLSCSSSLPIIGPPDRIESQKNRFKCNENIDQTSVPSPMPMASSLPNLNFLELPSPKMMPRHIDSIDLYKRIQIKHDLVSLKQEEMKKSDSNETEPDMMLKTETAKTNDCGQNRVRRKNSSMTPVLPDFEQMAKLREQSETNETKALPNITIGTVDNNNHDHLINGNISLENGKFETPNNLKQDDDLRLKTELENLEKSTNQKDDAEDEVLNGDNIKPPRLSLCSKGTKQESAAAWLAAATRQLSFCNNQLNERQSCRSAYNAQVELNAGNGRKKEEGAAVAIRKDILNVTNTNNFFNDDVQDIKDINPQIDIKQPSTECHSDKPIRKTSILRPPSKSFCDMNYVKKNVRFADSIGLELENVLHYVISPQMVTRRYSSYNPPNYLSHAGWNTDSWCGGKVSSINNPNKDNNYKVCNLNSTPDLAPRFQLVTVNFSNPSLLPDFRQKLFEKNVLVHSLTIAETTIYGIVSVVNKHFDKKVFVRYTFDNWANYIEREANYMIGSHDGQTDKFSFVIYAHPNDFSGQVNCPYRSPFYSNCSNQSKMYFAIRFITGNGEEEFWDNNDGQNYCLELKPFPMQSQ